MSYYSQIRFVGMLVLLAGAAILGCSPETPEQTVTEAESVAEEPTVDVPERLPETAEAPTEDDAEEAPEVTAWVQILDIEGEPLEDMAPIVTLQPNAFDAPLAVGQDSDAEGHSTIRFPGDRRLYLRAWDPELRYFPNNFYDVMPNTGQTVRDVTLWMVEGGAMEMLLVDPDGEPVAGRPVELMMYHPERGPWWPDDTVTDENGYARFETVPAGSYQIRLRTEAHGRLEIPEVNLRPGGVVNLGLQALRR